MRRFVCVGVGVALSWLAAAAAHAACLKANIEDQVVRGRLTAVTITMPDSGLKERGYILQLAAPACLEGEDEFDKVEGANRIHLIISDDEVEKRARALVSKQVRVQGEPFGQQNAQHLAPIVMEVDTIEPLGRR